MKKRTTVLFAFLSVVSLFAQPVTKQSTDMKQGEKVTLPQVGRGNAKVAYLGQSIDQMVYDFMAEKGIPGVTLAIVQAPYIPRVVGYGVSDAELGKLASAKTLWPIGPISQGYAAVAIMQLKEMGKLDLKDPISKFVKNLPEAWKNITVLQLMQHSSGIADYRNEKNFDITKEYSFEQLIGSVANEKLAFTPGTKVAQSATNFLILSEIVEKASKKSYRDFVMKHQIEFLGMKQNLFAQDLKTLKQEDVTLTGNKHKIFTMDKDYIDPAETSKGYEMVDGQLTVAKVANAHSLKGFSDLWASAENVSHWDIALAGGVLIKDPADRAMIYGATTLDNGTVVPAMAGWQFYAHPGLMDIKGNVTGYSAYLSRFTAKSELVCVTFLGNKEGVDFTPLARKVAAAFDPKLGAGINENELFTLESQFSVDQTIERLQERFKAMQMPVFAIFDHGQNAEKVGLKMRPSKVIVFGSPKVGTNLMIDNPSISLALPLKIAVYQDQNGSVWATFQKMNNLDETYPLKDKKILNNMNNLLEDLVQKATSIY